MPMRTLVLLALLLPAAPPHQLSTVKENQFMPTATAQEKKQAMSVQASFKRITPVLFVADVEPCLRFWEKLGFTRAMEVPDGNSLAFAAMQKGTLEVMYQSYASAEKDATASPATKQTLRSSSFLYVEVDNLEEVLRALHGAPLEVAPHDTFYGAREAVVRDPAGHFITFAHFGAR